MKFLKKILKNVVLSTLTIYSINLLIVHMGWTIPINYFSLGVTTILGLPGLILYSILVFKFCG